MPNKRKNWPPGPSWCEFGSDDQLGQLNYVTKDNILKAAQETMTRKQFSLSLSLVLCALESPAKLAGIV